MTSINSINVNAQGVGGSFGYNAKAKSEKKEAPEAEVKNAGNKQPQLSGDKVLGLMAQSAGTVSIAKTTIDPSKYVDKASAERIAGFMNQFEEIVATNLKAISDEFPEMSDGGKQTLALARFDQDM